MFDNNLIGLALSFVLVGLVIGLSTSLQKFNIVGQEGARKIVHIGVANWWIIVMLFIDNVWVAVVPPLIFIALNYLSYKKNLISAMERSEKDSLGTVYYPTSLLILTLLSFYLNMPEVGAIGILVMGYGDGLAGYFGKKYGKSKIFKRKTYVGSSAMFVASFAVSTVVTLVYRPEIALGIGFFVATIATILELLTPRDLDNLTVPIGSALTYLLILSIYDNGLTGVFAVAVIINSVIGYMAYRRNSLTIDGAISAIVVGSIIYVSAGWLAWLLLTVFFLSSTVISHFKKHQKEKLSSEYKKSKRNWRQVFANGLVPAVLSVAYYITDSPIYYLAVIASIAAACADTWASEIGVLNKGRTVSILTFHDIQKGESGGVSILGTAVSLIGSAFIGLVFAFLLQFSDVSSDINMVASVLIITVIGFCGSIIDSILGAALQVKYVMKSGRIVEILEKGSRYKKGFVHITNDTVNLLTGFIVGSFAVALLALLT